MQIFVCKLVVLLRAIGNKAATPKQCLSATGTTKMLQQAGRIMKLTAVLLLGVCMQIYAAGYGQKITLSERDVPIEKVLKKIQAQTSYKFLYTSQLLSGAPRVTVVVKDATVQDVLDLVLKGQMLDYEVSDETVVIKPRKELPGKVVTQVNMPDPIEVRGVITDENGAPAAGVNVMVKGTSKGTTTNLRGEFVLRDVSENAVLLITSVGYDRQEILVKGKAMINTQLKVAVGNLDEMQVIAYGTTSKRFNTGNVSTIKASDIEKQPVNNPLLALQGRVPGLVVTQANGIPGSGVTVRIQGQNSIRGGSDPLYVIDGVPYPSQMLITTAAGSVLGGSSASFYDPGGNGNPLSYINPSDIESIDILKDADATSIYGSRAANGAILITTKKGKAGPTRFDFNFQTGWGKVTKRMKMMNTQQYLEMRNEALKNDGIQINANDENYDVNGLWDQNRYTDWVEELSGGTSSYNNINGSINGGNGNVQYLLRGTYQRETTVFPGDYRDRKGSMHFNLNTKSANGKFKLQLSSTYMLDNNQLPRDDYTLAAYILPPNAPAIYNDDGTLNWAADLSGNTSWENPLAGLYKTYQNKTDNLINSAFLNYNILANLEISARLGYTKLSTDEFASNKLLSEKPENRPSFERYAQYTSSTIKIFIVEPQVKFKKKIGKGNLDVLLGSTIQQNSNYGQSINGSKYATDELTRDIRSAGALTVNSSVDVKYKYHAFFGRINYSLKDKYIVNLTYRRDGSSRFGPENRFQNFASLAAAWIFSDEYFLKDLSFLSFGKLKASYGSLGNDQIGDYTFMNLYVSNSQDVPYQNGNSIVSNRIQNPYLQWEETRKLSIGLDLGFLNDKISLSVVYGRNRSSNQLLPYSLPLISGFSTIDRNFPATVENINYEYSLNTLNIKTKKFEWRTIVNLTIPKNKLVKFPEIEKSSYARLLIVGQPLSIVQAYRFLGVNATTGIYQFEKSDGSIITNPSPITDRSVLINVDPRFYGGIQNSIRFSSFQVDVLFQYIKQQQSNSFRFGKSMMPGSFGYNQPVSVLKRWQKAGDLSSVQKFTTNVGFNTPYSRASQSDEAFVDASYLRLENLSLSYLLEDRILEKLKLRHCKFYFQGQNLLTLTNFGGIDPENRSLGSLAPLKIYTIGIQLGF